MRLVIERRADCIITSPLLFLQTACETLHDLFLEEEEYDHRRQPPEESGSHDLGVANAVGCLYGCQTHRNGHHPGVSDHNKRPDEVVPGRHKGQDRNGGYCWSRQWHQDMPVDAQTA